MFILNSRPVNWKSFKQQTVADSITEVKYIATSEATKEAIWMKKFIMDLRVVPEIERSVPFYCDNTGTVIQAKKFRSHQRSKHILRCFHLIQKIIERQDVILERVDTKNNIADPFTKAIS